tara:strand:- start:80 stop:322 length:243 start_codon:yes stop_codon:yes gene_type:complete
MSDYGIQPFGTLYDMCGDRIEIKKVSSKFITFDDFDDCGELYRKNVKRKVFVEEDGRLYINWYLGKKPSFRYKIYLNDII